MRTTLKTVAALSALAVSSIASADLIITGVVDGPLSPGGLPKAIELYVVNDIADLSVYGVGSANNGGGSDGEEFELSGSASAGDFLYIASETPGFQAYFGFAPNFTSSAALINGDDAIELFCNDIVIDTFGEIDVDGSNEPWEYLDGWAYRNNGTGPDGTTFDIDNWLFSGINALDGSNANSNASNPFPIGTYQIPAPGAISLLAVAGFAGRRRRRVT